MYGPPSRDAELRASLVEVERHVVAGVVCGAQIPERVLLEMDFVRQAAEIEEG